MSSSSSVSQAQLLCPRSNSFLDHKSSSSSTTTWRRGSSTRRSLLLRVCVQPQFLFTHQQLLQYTACLPRTHQTDTEATLRDHGSCKFSCVISLFLLPRSHSTCVCLLKSLDPIIVISSHSNQKIGPNLCKMQCLTMTSM